MKKQMTVNKKGFTLVELIVVIVVLGLLIALAMPTVLDSLKTNSKNIWADQVLKYGASVGESFTQAQAEQGAGAGLCYRIDKLKPSAGDKGCIIVDYNTRKADKVYVFNNQFYYSASAVGSFDALLVQKGKLVKEIPSGGLASFGSSVVSTTNCPATCLDPITNIQFVP